MMSKATHHHRQIEPASYLRTVILLKTRVESSTVVVPPVSDLILYPIP